MGPLYQNGHLLRVIRPECQRHKRQSQAGPLPKGPKPTSIPHICHGHKDGVRGEKICHVENFQISVHETSEES